MKTLIKMILVAFIVTLQQGVADTIPVSVTGMVMGQPELGIGGHAERIEDRRQAKIEHAIENEDTYSHGQNAIINVYFANRRIGSSALLWFSQQRPTQGKKVRHGSSRPVCETGSEAR